MKNITSVANDTVKKIASLQTSKGRVTHNAYAAEGLRTLERYKAAKIIPLELYVVEGLYTDCKILFPASDPVVVTDHVMKKMSSLTTHPGILGVFQRPDTSLENAQILSLSSGVVLMELSDPGNVGTLIRSSVACGHTTVYVINGVDPLCPKVIQASAGTVANATIIECTWDELVAFKNRAPLCAMVIKDGQSLMTLPQKHLLLVIGNEAHGLTKQVVTSCDLTASLPMDTAAESFNAAVAGSIGLFLLKHKALL